MQADLPPWGKVDGTWLSIGGVKRPVAVVLVPKGARRDLRLSGPGWFTVLAARGMQGLTTDDDPVYGPALEAAGLDRQPCTAHLQRTVGRHNRGVDEDDLTHLDRIRLPILQRLAPRETVMQGRVRLQPEVRKRLWHLVECWHELVRSQGHQGHPKVPASPHRLEGWRGRFQPGTRLTRGAGAEDRGGGPPLRAPDGPPQGLKRAHGTRGYGVNVHDGPQPMATKTRDSIEML